MRLFGFQAKGSGFNWGVFDGVGAHCVSGYRKPQGPKPHFHLCHESLFRCRLKRAGETVPPFCVFKGLLRDMEPFVVDR